MSQRLRWVLDIDIVKYFDSISHSHLRDFLDHRLQHHDDCFLRQLIERAPKIAEMLSLSAIKQGSISLWSGGPRPLMIPYGDLILIDVAGFVEFISRVFTGIRDDGEIRGRQFEETVRATIISNLPQEFEVGPRKIKEGGNYLKDEIDLLLRKDESVYVCECFSMWRPLDIEIGMPERIKTRLEQIEAKLDQAEETCAYLQTRRVGPGFDYSGAKNFIPIVVSPFIEWLPSTSDRYWISAETPRVMTLEELGDFIATR